MSQFLRDLPISRKLNLLVVVSITISLFLAGIGILIVDFMLLRNSLVRDLRSQARLVANTVNVALYFDSSFKADEMANIFSLNPTIMEAALFDKEGKLVKDDVGAVGQALYQRDKTLTFEPPQIPDQFGGYEDNSVVVFEPITYTTDSGPEYLGHVFIRSDLSELRNQTATHMKFLAVVFLASFGLGYLISQKFQALVADPIKSLAAKTAEISDSGDYSLRQPKTSADEIGDLTDSFNEMLDAIDKRDQELSATLTVLRQRDVDLVHALDQAEVATQAKSEFLAHMSHEIRTPMAGIVGMTNIALKTQLTDSQREYLSAVKTSADSLLLVVNEILDFSKIEAGQMELDPIPFDLEECLAGALKSVTLQAHLKELGLSCKVDHRLPRTLVGDPARISQIVINLVGNALKFTRDGWVDVSVRQLQADEDSVLLEGRVVDTGIGIEVERQHKIFDAFIQADSSTSRNFGGTGLGLTITARLVEMMGGEIKVQSETGSGSTFVFTLRLGLCDRPESALDQAAREALQGKTVWLACHRAGQAESVSEHLLGYGATVRRFEGEADLWTAVEAGELETQAPMAVLADADLAGQGGIKLLARLHEQGYESGAVLLRATRLAEDIPHYRGLGLRGHLLKPVRRRDLAELLLRWADPGAVPLLEEPAPPAGPGLAWLKVLVTDDNAVNRQMARLMLEGAGCQVWEADSGEQVLEHLQERGFPDVLLLDIMMPGMDGFECTRHVREREARQGRDRLPIIALTAHASKGYAERCLEADMDGYLSKPINEERMFELLSAYSPVIPPDRSGQPEDGDGLKAEIPRREGEELKVLDIEVSLKRVGGNMEILKAVAKAFLDTSRDQVEALEKAIAADDPAQLRFAAHTFKGLVLNFDARRAAAAAQTLEDMAGDGDLRGALPALQELKHRYLELRAEVEKL